ncbi:hypothetical protein LMH87_000561 [Akanthomyces muscarius]|uniref:Uncharacterized protein n=1 Tax=Akanthomyces muscarius TaxID=2231603 RepID=A0A9W8QES9_AKAMU|nr:hypothetical protein LMH87_000561 [Akanthomyces muscarius]KAJ4155307.1 hypothetical protein LMH87_000561 [Akanthomyces muscarius]
MQSVPGCSADVQYRVAKPVNRRELAALASARNAKNTPNNLKTHTELLAYSLGAGNFSPGSNTDSIDSGISMASRSTLKSGSELFEASPTTDFVDDNFFFVGDMRMQEDNNMWLNLSAFGEASPQSSEVLPSSPECQAVQSCSASLSTETSPLQIYPAYVTVQDCYHGEKIDQLLCEVMGHQWPVVTSYGPASVTDALSVLRDALNQLDILSNCAICMSSCKSMSLIRVITKAVSGHITSLCDSSNTFDEVAMHLGTYSADSAEECHFVYTQIMRRHVKRFADVADSFARDAQRAGWLVHVLSLQGVAAEARTLAHSEFGSM